MNNKQVLDAYKKACGLQPQRVGNYYPGKFFSSTWRETAQLRMAEYPIFSNVHTLAVSEISVCGRFWVDPKQSHESSFSAGSAWFRPANEGGGWETNSAISTFHLYLSDEYLKSLITEDHDIREGALEFKSKGLISDPLITQLLVALSTCKNDRNPPESRNYELSLIRALCLHLLTFNLAESKHQPCSPALTFEELLRKISNRPSDDYKLEQMAIDVSCSVQKLRALFLNTTGMPPHRYIIEKRLELAMSELMIDSKTIAQIATSTGFFDQAHFTHAFRKKHGLTPREAREKLSNY
ncbi:AraC family transcriptional regulator [Pseudomonas canadensis]|uniref:helix-turn-helix domain-containing protein n=1 Tax=Pseudomonas canadensis TaxID=915099 RepID=UPI002B245595|nr:AraC family transcriptional regulator [Pseudomonas canadensis]MEB2647781.1 AraC family transcriptional regulator [Pseudomonas canadensis]